MHQVKTSVQETQRLVGTAAEQLVYTPGVDSCQAGRAMTGELGGPETEALPSGAVRLIVGWTERGKKPVRSQSQDTS